MKEYSKFARASSLGSHYQVLECHIQDIYLGRSNLSTEMQSEYTTDPTNKAEEIRVYI